MAETIANNQNRNLWAEAKKIKQTNSSIPNVVDNYSGAENINSLFAEKFKNLYNSVGFNEKDLDYLRSKLNIAIEKDCNDNELTADNFSLVNVNDVKLAITRFKSNKKEENGLNVNHFKLKSNRLYIVLSLLFNSMLVHGIAPDELLVGK